MRGNKEMNFLQRMLIVTLMVLTVSLFTTDAKAATGGPDTFGYIWNDGVSHQWIDISGSGTSLGLGEDGYDTASIGFTFNFYGSDFTTAYIGENGMIGFAEAGMGSYSPTSLPDSGTPNNLIAPFWEDLTPNGGGGIYYETQGSAPNRVFIVQYQDRSLWEDNSNKVTFQARLYEGSNNIIFAYDSYIDTGAGGNGSYATVGIENSDGTDGLMYSYSTAFDPQNLSVAFGVDDGINEAPAPSASDILILKNTVGTTVVGSGDPDISDTHSYAVDTAATNGTAEVDGSGNVTYTPNADYTGDDSFIIEVTDSGDLTGTTSVSVTVLASDSLPPTDGNLDASSGLLSVVLSWTDATDAMSGVASYKLVANAVSEVPAFPTEGCSDGTVLYEGSDNSYYHLDGVTNETYLYRLCAIDGVGNVSDGVTGDGEPYGSEGAPLEFPGYDDSNMPGVERFDGGNEWSNLDPATGNPMADTEFTFGVVVTDSGTPQSVFVKITSDFWNTWDAVELTCHGSDFTNGVLCTTTVNLGPAEVYFYEFEAEMSDESTETLFPFGEEEGPGYIEVKMLTGYSMVGIAHDGITGEDANESFYSGSVIRWDSYSKGTNDTPDGDYVEATTVQSGNGYFVFNEEEGSYVPSPEVSSLDTTTHSTALVEGWNIITTPYANQINLADIKIENVDTGAVQTWAQATNAGVVAAALYYYNGSDWGDTYGYITVDSDTQLAPWNGYWLYLAKTGNYNIIIDRPEDRGSSGEGFFF